jgi:hypothetical protein
MDARNYPPDETAFHQVKDAPTQADDEMNRSNTEYKDVSCNPFLRHRYHILIFFLDPGNTVLKLEGSEFAAF